jgi:hypothetical protein
MGSEPLPAAVPAMIGWDVGHARPGATGGGPAAPRPPLPCRRSGRRRPGAGRRPVAAERLMQPRDLRVPGVQHGADDVHGGIHGRLQLWVMPWRTKLRHSARRSHSGVMASRSTPRSAAWARGPVSAAYRGFPGSRDRRNAGVPRRLLMTRLCRRAARCGRSSQRAHRPLCERQVGEHRRDFLSGMSSTARMLPYLRLFTADSARLAGAVRRARPRGVRGRVRQQPLGL